MLSNIIDEEDKTNPLSDEALMELLDKNGISLSRRTISKYREKWIFLLHVCAEKCKFVDEVVLLRFNNYSNISFYSWAELISG